MVQTDKYNRLTETGWSQNLICILLSNQWNKRISMFLGKELHHNNHLTSGFDQGQFAIGTVQHHLKA